MKAVVYTKTGASSTLTLVEREPGEPGHGEVRVRIAVSGVIPTDWKARARRRARPGSPRSCQTRMARASSTLWEMVSKGWPSATECGSSSPSMSGPPVPPSNSRLSQPLAPYPSPPT